MMINESGEKTAEQPITALSQLPQLFNRLFDQLLKLLNTQVALVKTELREAVKSYGKQALCAALAAILALLGLALLSVGLTFWLNLYIENLAISFALVGLVYLIGGLVAAIGFAKKLVNQPPVLAQTKEELEKDKQWIKTETHQAT